MILIVLLSLLFFKTYLAGLGSCLTVRVQSPQLNSCIVKFLLAIIIHPFTGNAIGNYSLNISSLTKSLYLLHFKQYNHLRCVLLLELPDFLQTVNFHPHFGQQYVSSISFISQLSDYRDYSFSFAK